MYASVVLIKAALVYGDIKGVFPEEMRKEFIGMAIVAPFYFTLVFLIGCFVILRLAVFSYGTWRRLTSKQAVQLTR